MTLYLSRYLKKPVLMMNPTIRRHSAITALLPLFPTQKKLEKNLNRMVSHVHPSHNALKNCKSSSLPNNPQIDMKILLDCAISIGDDDMKLQYLNTILIRVQEMVKTHSPLTDIFENTLTLFKGNVFRRLPDMPSYAIYADAKVEVPVNHWMSLRQIYNVFILVIRNCPNDFVQPYITNDFLDNLITLLNSPEAQEQTALSTILFYIYDHMPDLKKLIFHKILHELELSSNGIISYNGINTILRFFIHFHKNLIGFFLANNNRNFFKYILPLFSRQLSSDYLPSLLEFTSLIAIQHNSIAVITLEYLIKTWPETDSIKGALQFTNVQILAQYLNANQSKLISHRLFGIIANGIQSPNFKIALAAISICSDLQFLSKFSCCSSSIISQIAYPLKEATLHWNNDVVIEARTTIQKLYAFNNRAMAKMMIKIDDRRDVNIEACVSWAEVLKTAKLNDETIDVGDFKMKLEQFLNTVRY